MNRFSIVFLIGTIATVESVLSRGSNILISESAKNQVTSHALGSYRIKTVSLREKVGFDQDEVNFFVRECGKHCSGISACNSFVIDQHRKHCILSRMNRCENPTALLIVRDGYDSYEMQAISQDGPPKSCFQQCLDIKGNTCASCGRNLCSGSTCSECINTCWNVEPMFNGTMHVFAGGGRHHIPMTCIEQWQQISANNIIQHARTLADVFVKPAILRLSVKYSNGVVQTSYFASFRYSGSRVSVGDYLGGDAGNSWEAPFSDRLHSNQKTSNCKTFYYTGPCNMTTIPSYEEQIAMNRTSNQIERQIFWKSCNNDVYNATVESITFYVTPAENVDIASLPMGTAQSCLEDAQIAVEQPMIAIDEPVMLAQEPMIAVGEPVMLAEEPMMAVDEPVMLAQEPMVMA